MDLPERIAHNLRAIQSGKMRVDCLMPTLPHRANMRLRAIASLNRQTIPTDWDMSLALDSHPTDSLGTKLNRLIVKSDADYFVLTDDDDWHHPRRVLAQVSALIEGFEVSGTSQIYYFDEAKNHAFLYSGNPNNWIGGLAFTRKVWDRCKFGDFTQGVDTQWLRKSKAKRLDLASPFLFVAGLHAHNSCPKNVWSKDWSTVEVDQLPKEFLETLSGHA